MEFWYPPKSWSRHLSTSSEAGKVHFSGDDKVIIEKFQPLYEKAAKGELSHWLDDHYGRLALILLMDNLCRNMFRGQARAFETDGKSYEIANNIVSDPKIFDTYRFYE